MLNPAKDRLDYGAVLSPPAGYQLDCAVGTTYSLDLDALVGACLALGLSEDTDSDLLNNPICLLEALRSVGEKMVLFTESGQIHMPSKPTALYVLLEKIVFTVTPSKRRGIAAYPSFHPKMWLIRYVNNTGGFIYRFIVLSRNLTFDRSWDVTYFMEGEETGEEVSKNAPLADFLHYLTRQLPKDENGKEKASHLRELRKALSHVKFEPSEKEFYDYEFLPTGIPAVEGGYHDVKISDLFQNTYHDLLIISPFLTGSVLRDFNNRDSVTGLQKNRFVLITREFSLGKLKAEDVDNFDIYIMQDAIVDGESALEDQSQNPQSQDIHAKVYMTRKNSDASLYLGSLNATYNAVYGNVEFMLRLLSKNQYLNIDSLTEGLFCGKESNEDNPFQKVTMENAIIDEIEDSTNALNAVIKTIARNKPTAIICEEEGKYSIHVTFEQIESNEYDISVKPLLSERSVPFSDYVVFSGLSMTKLSEFYAISVSDGETTVERVLLIPTENLPSGRETAVVNSVIANKEAFYRYVAFVLGDDANVGSLEGTVFGMDCSVKASHTILQTPALYEKMLKTAVANPAKFDGIEYLLQNVTEDGVIPDDFKHMYKTFKRVVSPDG